MAQFDTFHSMKNNFGVLLDIGSVFIERVMHKVFHLACPPLQSTKIVEIGPGKAVFAKVCQQHGIANYTAIEANSGACHRLREKGMSVIQGTVPPFPEMIFPTDLIVAMAVIEHMKDREQAIEFVTGIREMLTEGGLILLTAPDITCWKWDFWCDDYTHSFVTSQENLRRLLAENGFEIVTSRMISKFCFTKLCYLLWFASKLIISRKRKWRSLKKGCTPRVLIIGRKTKE
jgi:hypothetical protein